MLPERLLKSKRNGCSSWSEYAVDGARFGGAGPRNRARRRDEHEPDRQHGEERLRANRRGRPQGRRSQGDQGDRGERGWRPDRPAGSGVVVSTEGPAAQQEGEATCTRQKGAGGEGDPPLVQSHRALCVSPCRSPPPWGHRSPRSWGQVTAQRPQRSLPQCHDGVDRPGGLRRRPDCPDQGRGRLRPGGGLVTGDAGGGPSLSTLGFSLAR